MLELNNYINIILDIISYFLVQFIEKYLYI